MGCKSYGRFSLVPLQRQHQGGTAATEAEAVKCQKYNDLLNNYHFQPVAIASVYAKSIHRNL